MIRFSQWTVGWTCCALCRCRLRTLQSRLCGGACGPHTHLPAPPNIMGPLMALPLTRHELAGRRAYDDRPLMPDCKTSQSKFRERKATPRMRASVP